MEEDGSAVLKGSELSSPEPMGASCTCSECAAVNSQTRFDVDFRGEPEMDRGGDNASSASFCFLVFLDLEWACDGKLGGGGGGVERVSLEAR